MSGLILTIAQQKGGSGKTTLSAHLATALAYAKMRVAILVSALGLFVNSGLMWACTVRWPEEGTAIGLSIACLWSLVHMGYAGTWLRRHAPAAPAPAA